MGTPTQGLYVSLVTTKNYLFKARSPHVNTGQVTEAHCQGEQWGGKLSFPDFHFSLTARWICIVLVLQA